MWIYFFYVMIYYKMPGEITVEARAEKLFTLTASGNTGNVFNYALPAPMNIGNKYEIALVSADLAGFKTKAYHQFKIDMKEADVQGKSLYVHSGKWSSTEDNVIDIHERVYRKFICGNKTISNLELEIKNKADGQLVPTAATEPTSFITVHIRHCEDELQNEFHNATKLACDSIATAHVALKAVQDNIHVKLQQLHIVSGDIENKLGAINNINVAIRDNVLLVKGSQDLANGLLGECKQATVAVQTAVDNANNAISGGIAGVSSMTESVRTAVQDSTIVLEGFKNANDSAHTALKAAVVSVNATCDNARLETEAAKIAVLAGTTHVVDACNLIKTEVTLSTIALQNANAATAGSVDAAKNAITNSLSGISSMAEQIRNAAEDVNSSVGAANTAIVTKLGEMKVIDEAHKAAQETFAQEKLASDVLTRTYIEDTGGMVLQVKSAIDTFRQNNQASITDLKNNNVQIKNYLNAFKNANDDNHEALKVSVDAVKEAADSIKNAVDQHKAVSESLDGKSRYKLVN